MNIRAILLAFTLAVPSLKAAPLKQQAPKAAQSEDQVIETIKTFSGKTYHHCRIYKVDPDGVMFFHEKGGAKVLFLDLPQDICDKLGYNPQKSAAYNDDLADKNKKRREQANALRKAAATQVLMAQVAQMRAAAEYAGYQAPSYSNLPPGDLFYPIGGIASAAGLADLSNQSAPYRNCDPRWLGYATRRFTDRIAWNGYARDNTFFTVPSLRATVPALHGQSPVFNNYPIGFSPAPFQACAPVARATAHVTIPAQNCASSGSGGGGHRR